MTAPQLWWTAAGRPPHTYPNEQPATGYCATCAAPITSGVPIDSVVTPTFASHGDLLRFGTHVCPACAWLYTIGKGQPGNIIAAGSKLWRPMISHDAAAEGDRPQWVSVLREIAAMPPDTPVAGVLTPDPKPRLWPRAELCSVGSFGLYLHNSDWDLSEFRLFDLNRCLEIVETVTGAIAADWTKQLIRTSLFGDFKRASKDMLATVKMETELQSLRQLTEFLPALLIAGMTKDAKRAASNTAVAIPYTRPDPSPVQSRPDHPAGTERLQRRGRERSDAGTLSLFDFD